MYKIERRGGRGVGPKIVHIGQTPFNQSVLSLVISWRKIFLKMDLKTIDINIFGHAAAAPGP